MSRRRSGHPNRRAAIPERLIRFGRLPRRAVRHRDRALPASSVTRSGKKTLMTLRMMKVPDAGEGNRRSCRHDLIPELFRVAEEQPVDTAIPPVRSSAKRPVARAPQMPPMPWTAKTSSASSIPSFLDEVDREEAEDTGAETDQDRRGRSDEAGRRGDRRPVRQPRQPPHRARSGARGESRRPSSRPARPSRRRCW